jgi:hypothetical protein
MVCVIETVAEEARGAGPPPGMSWMPGFVTAPRRENRGRLAKINIG